MKNQKGITLISIVITVIILIIIAGVSIAYTNSNSGIVKNAEKASENLKQSEAKEFILEAWAYALSKIENNDVPNYDSTEARVIQNQAGVVFRKYITEYGIGMIEKKSNGSYIYTIRKAGKDYSAIRVKFRLKGEEEYKTFYIVNDKICYESKEVSLIN